MLNPLVIIHLMGGVHNEMLMVGLMMAGIALTFAGRHVGGAALIAVAVAVKATAVLALAVHGVGLGAPSRRKPLAGVRSLPPRASVATFVAVFATLSGLAGVGLGWLTALAGSVRIINWLTIPTAVANLTDAIGSLLVPVNFYAVLDVTRLVGIAIIVGITSRCCGGGFGTPTGRRCRVSPGRWWSSCCSCRPHCRGTTPGRSRWSSALAQSRAAIALIAGFSTWIMVIFKPDGSHGMYSWLHVVAGHRMRGDGVVFAAAREIVAGRLSPMPQYAIA